MLEVASAVAGVDLKVVGEEVRQKVGEEQQPQ